ncbi:hypothetical protein CMI37_09105 [Candidatus Pacearchaeota archaeon]|nr:hypothetical protein [Candidatus Pacearchaeota archaeon]
MLPEETARSKLKFKGNDRRCLECDTDMSNRHASARFCSYPCREKYRNKKGTLTDTVRERYCLQCEADISHRHINTVYCSMKCSVAYRGIAAKPDVNKECLNCGKDVTQKRNMAKYCSRSCRGMYTARIHRERKTAALSKQATHAARYNNPDIGKK